MSASARGGSFFRTMVLMGSSVALGSGAAAGCGGMADLVPGTGSGPGAGGSPGSGGKGSGGSGGASSGGANTGSGGVIFGDGGSAAGGLGGLGGAFPTDCPMTQLVCETDDGPYCVGSNYPTLPAGCVCDPTRPASAEDCEAGQELVCMGALADANGEPFDPLAPFNCECVPGQAGTDCGQRCEEHSGSVSWASCSEPDPTDIAAYLCGCAAPILK